MVVGFTTTYAISTHHHQSCEFESCSGEVYSIQHYVMKLVGDLRQVGGFLRILRFPPPRYKSKIVESGVKHHKYSYKYQDQNYSAFTFNISSPMCSLTWDSTTSMTAIIKSCNGLVLPNTAPNDINTVAAAKSAVNILKETHFN